MATRKKHYLSKKELAVIQSPEYSELRKKVYDKYYVPVYKDWYPQHPPQEYDLDFVEWINRINKDFSKHEGFYRFDLYRKQAMMWLEEKEPNLSSLDYEHQVDYLTQEYYRCKQNTLYFANRYGWLVEGSVDDAKVKYNAWKAQEIILFLSDCGYSLMIGKPRQVGFTSTMGMLAIKNINFRKNFFIKFITHSSEKGEEILRDKIKNVFYHIPEFLKNNPGNNAEREFTLSDKSDKGNLEGMNSRVLVNTPTADAINGGSPNLVLVDEIGFISIFSRILSQGRPTMFMYDQTFGRQIMKRQLIAWGTGGYVDSGGDAFENEFRACMQRWEEKDYGYGIIPLFFNAYSREGLTKEMFQEERARAYSVLGRDKETKRVEFHQAYPMTLDDMFLRSSKTIIPVNTANEHLYKIFSLPDSEKPQYGYFDPIYDINQPTPDGDYPYKIRGANFVPTTGVDDPFTTTVIWQHPKNYIHRYYQGTDPITSETGHSKMSSAIWDKLDNTVSSVVFFRGLKPKEAFIQCILQNIYYNPLGVDELIENNLGDFYLNFRENLGFKKNITPMAALDPTLRTTAGGKWWGISNKSNTGEKIIQHMMDMIDLYIDNIYIPWFFLQCKTFVEKDLRGGGTNLRNTRYQAADLRYDYDDVLFSVTFAYINAISHQKYEPQSMDFEGKKSKMKYEYICGPETNFITYLAVKSKGGKHRRLRRM